MWLQAFGVDDGDDESCRFEFCAYLPDGYARVRPHSPRPSPAAPASASARRGRKYSVLRTTSLTQHTIPEEEDEEEDEDLESDVPAAASPVALAASSGAQRPAAWADGEAGIRTVRPLLPFQFSGDAPEEVVRKWMGNIFVCISKCAAAAAAAFRCLHS